MLLKTITWITLYLGLHFPNTCIVVPLSVSVSVIIYLHTNCKLQVSSGYSGFLLLQKLNPSGQKKEQGCPKESDLWPLLAVHNPCKIYSNYTYSTNYTKSGQLFYLEWLLSKRILSFKIICLVSYLFVYCLEALNVNKKFQFRKW